MAPSTLAPYPPTPPSSRSPLECLSTPVPRLSEGIWRRVVPGATGVLRLVRPEPSRKSWQESARSGQSWPHRRGREAKIVNSFIRNKSAARNYISNSVSLSLSLSLCVSVCVGVAVCLAYISMVKKAKRAVGRNRSPNGMESPEKKRHTAREKWPQWHELKLISFRAGFLSTLV